MFEDSFRWPFMLISVRKSEDLWVRPCLSDHNLCRVFSPLLDSTGWTIDDSIDALSDKFQAQLREDKLVGLLDSYFPLQRHCSRAKQAEASALSLGNLKGIRCYLRDRSLRRTETSGCGSALWEIMFQKYLIS